MFYKNFIEPFRKLLEEKVEIVPFDDSVSKVEQFVPVTDKNGNLLTIGMQVDFEPIKSNFTSYSPDWAIKTGNVRPLASYPPSAFQLVDYSSQLNTKNIE